MCHVGHVPLGQHQGAGQRAHPQVGGDKFHSIGWGRFYPQPLGLVTPMAWLEFFAAAGGFVLLATTGGILFIVIRATIRCSPGEGE